MRAAKSEGKAGFYSHGRLAAVGFTPPLSKANHQNLVWWHLRMEQYPPTGRLWHRPISMASDMALLIKYEKRVTYD